MSKLIRKSNKGFTLIELMIVVAIIGILAAIAIPNFLRFQLKSKSSEGKVNIAAIRTAEEAYLAEFGQYVAVALTPNTVPGVQKDAWPVAGTDGVDEFDQLGWSPEGQVFFSYEVAASVSAMTITAGADIDGDGTNQEWGYVKPTTGTTTGIAPASLTTQGCTATGLTRTGGNLLRTVGPCGTTSGQSVF
ncbi:MAG: type IV pilin protein [Myxococcota bacterium]